MIDIYYIKQKNFIIYKLIFTGLSREAKKR